MWKRAKQGLAVLSVFFFIMSASGCSIFISTPRIAKIHIQGLDNKHFDYIIALDEPITEANLDIQISEHYTLQLDFEWLWDSSRESRLEHGSPEEETNPALVPWMLCKYRF